jgi:large subunit ribosomal protein L25
MGVKQQGGILDHVLREVEIECLPGDIPSSLPVDVTNLAFGDVLRVSDLPHGGSLKFITDANQAVAHVTAVKEEVAPAPEAVAADAAAAPAEPEVIKKGKQETEEEGAEAKKGEAKKPEGKK